MQFENPQSWSSNRINHSKRFSGNISHTHTYHRFGVYLYIPNWCNFPGDLRWRSLAAQLNLPTSQAPFIINYQKIHKRFLGHEPDGSSRNHSVKQLTGPHLFGSPSSRPPVLSTIFRSDDPSRTCWKPRRLKRHFVTSAVISAESKTWRKNRLAQNPT